MRAQRAAVLGVCVLLAAGCQAPSTDPLREISRGLEQYPRYSIILADMDVSGTFFKTYQHRYKVLYGEQKAGEEETGVAETAAEEDLTDATETAAEEGLADGPETAAEEGLTDATETAAEEGLTFDGWDTQWMEVDRKFYEQHEPHLGMVLLSKGEDGNIDEAAYPPGYQYVGNSRYGTWRTDTRGTSFWEFYGKYYFFSRLLGGYGRPIYRSDYNTYRSSRQRRQPYFGPANTYGTRGSYTRTSNPKFYERQQIRQRAQSERFSQKARSRTSGARSRSGGRGK